jgi:tripartite-type tricarboxylate transporter receptor subunit TctC
MRFSLKPARTVAMAIATIAAIGLTTATVQAQQDFPNRRLSLVVPFPPGGSADAIGRLVADKLSAKERLGQPVIIDNRSGAATYIGSDYVTRAAPDGHTILFAGDAYTAPKVMYTVQDFDPARLAPIGRLVEAPFMVVVPAELPVRNMAEFIAYARANPGKLNYGVVNSGTMQLDMANFAELLKAGIADVPFNGAAPIVTSLLGNQVQMSFLGVSAIPHVQSGKLRALAVTSKSRWVRMPDVPSMTEVGFDFDSTFWYGLSVPVATPPQITARLARETADVLKQKEVREAISKFGMDPLDSSPAEMTDRMRSQRARNEAALKLLKKQPSQQ